jgi:beta-lactamase regulating signal transducer with metallopeptidase domain
MSLAHALTSYLSLNLMIFVAWGGLAIFAFAFKRFNLRLSSRTELQIHYGAVFFALTLALIQPLIEPLLPRNDFFQPPIKVWSASSLQTFGQQIASENGEGYLSLPLLEGKRALPARWVADVWSALAFVILIVGGALFLRDIRSLAALRKRAYLIRKIGRVRIFVSDFAPVPFSYWLPNQAHVVISSSLLSSPQNFKIAVAHELQHHRQGDTLWLYIIWGMRWVCALNPAIYF